MSADPNDTGFSETHRKPNATRSFQTADSQDDNEERYPATPLQLAMLLHSIVPPGEGVYVQQKMAAQLRANGIVVKIDPQVYPNGRFAKLHDPEGNPIQLWQPGGEDRG